MFHQNKILSILLRWIALDTMGGWEILSAVFLASVFFDSTATTRKRFSSILACSTLFLLSHIVAYFPVPCHLFKKTWQSLYMLLLFITPGQHNVTAVFAPLDHDLWLQHAVHLSSAHLPFLQHTTMWTGFLCTLFSCSKGSNFPCIHHKQGNTFIL